MCVRLYACMCVRTGLQHHPSVTLLIHVHHVDSSLSSCVPFLWDLIDSETGLIRLFAFQFVYLVFVFIHRG